MKALSAPASNKWFLICLFFAACLNVSAQQPFVTDDADVTPKGKFHFEFSNEFDLLQRSAFPNLKQNTSDFELNYGLLEGLEIGIQVPLITLVNAQGATLKTAVGLGDTNISLKYNFRKERDGSPFALAIAANIELPTGDKEKQLGSGLSDFYINGILQKGLTKTTTLRLNGGVLFSGNQTTGVIGIRSRGTVLTAGGSVVKRFTPKLQIGMELTGARSKDPQLGKGQLQAILGGNFQLVDRASFDFGVVAGKYVASPRLGIQLGVSIDF